MKRLFVLTIAGIFTVGIAVKLAYGWGASASCWESGQTRHANAMAGSYGLHNGRVEVCATVGNDQSDDDEGFGNEFIYLTAHASGGLNDDGEAESSVHGLDEDDIPRAANAFDDEF